MPCLPTGIPFAKRVMAAAFSLMLWLVGATAVGQTKVSGETQELPPNQTLECEITGAEIHRYKFDLKANEFFQVRVEQETVNVMLKHDEADVLLKEGTAESLRAALAAFQEASRLYGESATETGKPGC